MTCNPITITCAPCCWGFDDVKNPHLPAWEKVLDEAAQAGFGRLELGPYGYMPLDEDRVGDALRRRGLSIIAGTIFDDLVSPANRDSLLRQTNEICAFITALPKPAAHPGQHYDAPYLTVMDWGHDERDYAAGHPDRAPRLDNAAWLGMMDNIRGIAELARDRYGVRPMIHPHADGYIEFEDELERMAVSIDPETAGLCLDTGGCRIGKGNIDYLAIRSLLTELGYGGYITIEQERDPRNAISLLDDLAASRSFLRDTGF